MFGEQLNWRFLLTLLGATVLVVIGWSTVHGYQVSRNTDALLSYADRAEADGRPDRALRLLTLYLDRRPSDAATRARHAFLFEGLAR
ncbi:MAG: hypothetical protein ACRD36_07060 [Candidatus Acidiferrum sp.]